MRANQSAPRQLAALGQLNFCGVADKYLATIAKRCDVFVSINHEANKFTVRDLMGHKFPDVDMTRNPYWLRQGYVDEVAVFGAKSRQS